MDFLPLLKHFPNMLPDFPMFFHLRFRLACPLSSALSFFLISRMSVWKTSSTKCLRAADVSKKWHSNCRAKAWPSSVVTCLFPSKSFLLPTKTIGMFSVFRMRSICSLYCAASRNVCRSVIEYTIIKPSPLRMYCSCMAVNSCCKNSKTKQSIYLQLQRNIHGARQQFFATLCFNLLSPKYPDLNSPNLPEQNVWRVLGELIVTQTFNPNKRSPAKFSIL